MKLRQSPLGRPVNGYTFARKRVFARRCVRAADVCRVSLSASAGAQRGVLLWGGASRRTAPILLLSDGPLKPVRGMSTGTGVVHDWMTDGNYGSCEHTMESLPRSHATASHGSALVQTHSSVIGPVDRNPELIAGATPRCGAAIDALIASTGVPLTRPDKILFGDGNVTKRDLARYYVSAITWMLPHIENRLAVLVRCPDGLQKDCFYQKHPGPGTPSFLQRVSVKEKESTSNYLVINDLAGLVWLAQSSSLELNVWGSKIDDIERPDRIVFDLDPDVDVPWPVVVDSAKRFRDVLRSVGLESFVRTTGGHGLHVVAPIQRRSRWDEVKAFSHAVATSIEASEPNRYTSKMSKAARKGKIFIDYLRNQRGATSIACYSPRARPGAPIATPLHWNELNSDVHSDRFRIGNISARFSELLQDPWKEMFTVRQSLTVSAKKAFGL